MCVSHGYSLQLAPVIAGGEDDVYDAPYTCFSLLQRRTTDTGQQWKLLVSVEADHIKDIPASARGDPVTDYGLSPSLRPWGAAGPRGKLVAAGVDV